ncbi:hypothetical protein N1851_000525 [Merluccius polli]|uniref:CARD domain-containing protein n=1 Tax=Merluccius polli TaxID=89951 RepID=A0AA47NCA5_MERPO|nr:hypothetical protein N1851_000525 [Merluccius polli]
MKRSREPDVYVGLKEEKGTMPSLLDLLLKKGESACQAFVSLLWDDPDVKATFPRLKELDWTESTSRPLPLVPPPPGSTPGPPNFPALYLCPLAPNSYFQLPVSSHPALPDSTLVSQTGLSDVLRARPMYQNNHPDWTRKPEPKQTRLELNLQGYLQQVSELIQGEDQFFRTQLLNKAQAWSVVVCNIGLRQDFITAQTRQSLVVLEGLAEGRANNTVIFDQRSRFQVLVDRQATAGDPQIGILMVTLDQLLSKKNDGYGKEVQRSTSPSGNPHSSLEAVAVEILGLRLKAKFCCPESHLLKDLSSRQDVDCGRCDMKYSQADLKRVLSGRLRDRQSKRVLKLKDVHIRYLLKEALEGGRDTIDKLEMALKEVCFLQVTIYQNNVIAVSRTSPGTS